MFAGYWPSGDPAHNLTANTLCPRRYSFATTLRCRRCDPVWWHTRRRCYARWAWPWHGRLGEKHRGQTDPRRGDFPGNSIRRRIHIHRTSLRPHTRINNIAFLSFSLSARLPSLSLSRFLSASSPSVFSVHIRTHAQHFIYII